MTVESPIFAPAIVLVLWSLFMLAWLALTRLPAMAKAGISLGTVVGARGVNLEGVIADRVDWRSHNYTHLMEQPTLFYATGVILGVVGQGDGLNLQLAWAYVFLRIVHSIVQATWNRVAVRFTLFSLATVDDAGVAGACVVVGAGWFSASTWALTAALAMSAIKMNLVMWWFMVGFPRRMMASVR